VVKASDYKVSPFELESVLIEHPAVAEAARVRRLEFYELPKAHVRQDPGGVGLRHRETDLEGNRPPGEYRDEDFLELKG
jgi:acetyl-CoA synthetase